MTYARKKKCELRVCEMVGREREGRRRTLDR